ncbi:MAG: hypothetical protein R3E83_18540 [Burkholderiaceae bacterium]
MRIRFLCGWLAALATVSFPLMASAQPRDDVFASDGSTRDRASCERAFAACIAARRLEQSRDPRVRAAGSHCRADLDAALAHEHDLNQQVRKLSTMKGRARDEYYAGTVQPTMAARGSALARFNDCSRQAIGALEDLRPVDGVPPSALLLHGGVSNAEPPPGVADPDAWKATLAETLHRMDEALDPAAEPLKNLSNVLRAIAPHYDMVSRSDTGVRVIRDILIDMGVGHLGGRVVGGLRGMARQADDLAAAASRPALTAPRPAASVTDGGIRPVLPQMPGGPPAPQLARQPPAGATAPSTARPASSGGAAANPQRSLGGQAAPGGFH